MTAADAPARRFGRAVLAAGDAFHQITGRLDDERHDAALRALRELWAVACEAGDAAYFAKLARHLADEHGLGEPATLYQQLTEVELLDLHTAQS